MPRGCRFIILAVAGLALVGAAPNKEDVAEGKQAAAEQDRQSQLERIATAIEKFPQHETKDSGCQPGQDKRESDLCAQWKAADAAAESAIWTAKMFWAGIAGLFIAAFTLIFAGRAAHWAKQAAFETKRSADISWEIGLAQSSPYLTINEGSGFQSSGKDTEIKMFAEITNHGPAPAIRIIPFGIFYAGDFQEPHFAVRVKWSKRRLNAVGAHQSNTLEMLIADPAKQKIFDTLRHDLIYPGSLLLGIRYEDEFGNVWVQRQRIILKIWHYKTDNVPSYVKFEGTPNKVAPPRKRLKRLVLR